MKKIYCSNCNKYGHSNKQCNEPIISVGIICISLDISKNTNQITNKELDNITNFNYSRLSNLNKIQFYKNKIKFLLVQRKHSLNYINFIRGLYNETDYEQLKEIFSYMSKEEINKIYKYDFSYLWSELWNKTANKKIYQKEYYDSMNKFNYLKDNNLIKKLYKIGSIYDSPEWEIPKGKKNYNETNLECAMREFNEETGINNDQYSIFKNIYTLHDNFIGTDSNNYRHVYYIGLYNNYENIDNININNIKSKDEISQVKWCTWDEAISLIRPYHQNRINIINKVFLLMINLNEEDYNCII